MNTLLVAAVLAAVPPAGAADPAAPVPRLQYRSVFQPPRPEPQALDWQQANETVGQFPRGHIDLLKWEERQPAPAPRQEAR